MSVWSSQLIVESVQLATASSAKVYVPPCTSRSAVSPLPIVAEKLLGPAKWNLSVAEPGRVSFLIVTFPQTLMPPLAKSLSCESVVNDVRVLAMNDATHGI